MTSPAIKAKPPGETTTKAVLVPGLKRLFKMSWEAKKYFAVATITGILFGLFQIFTGSLIGQATEKVIIPSFQRGEVVSASLWTIILAILGVSVIRATLLVGRRVWTMFAIYDLLVNYRSKLLNVFSKTKLRWHRQHSTGTLLSTVYADTEAAMQALMPWAFAIGTAFMLLYGIVLVAVVDWVMLIVMLIIFILLIATNLAFQIKATPIVTKVQVLRAEVSQIAHESFEGAQLVKSLGKEQDEDERFTKAANELRDYSIKFGYLRSWFDPFIDALPNLGIILFSLLGAYRISQGAFSTGDLVTITYLFTLMSVPIRSFGWVLSNLPRTVIGGERVDEIINTPIAETDPNNLIELEYQQRPARVEFDQVTFEYDDDPALREVSFSADEAEDSRVIAVVGSTGSGKSTLTLLAARLLEPDSGSIKLDGFNLSDLTPESLHQNVALVLQQAFIFEDTVRQNVTLGQTFSDEEIMDALEIAQAKDFVMELEGGLDAKLTEGGASLSGGQRQRLALARAIIRKPRLLILDDATSATDPAVEAAILAGIQERLTSSTLLLIAYRKSTIAIADQVVFMQNGTVVQSGTHRELLSTNEDYKSLVEAYDEAAIAHNILESEQAPKRSNARYNIGTHEDADKAADQVIKSTEAMKDSKEENR